MLLSIGSDINYLAKPLSLRTLNSSMMVVGRKVRQRMTCKKCNGSGFLSYFENQSPLGSGLTWNEEFIDFCNCLDRGLCPSCGMFWKDKNDGFSNYCDGETEEFGCIFCLWNSTSPPGNEPFEDDCWLTLEEMFKAPSRRESNDLWFISTTPEAKAANRIAKDMDALARWNKGIRPKL